ncbi:hypothetical protein ACIBCH_09690 [Amycolatopsis thailandensis]|uniref:hypothetical protein n=1 Tax=Amycolatopsis thailandensis TaxID=589330 RepID=UPI0037B9D590
MTELSLAAKMAVLRALEHQVKVVKFHLTNALTEDMETGDTKSAKLPDGSYLGKVTYVEGSVATHVASETEFLAWVKEHHPSEVRESVSTAFRMKVLAEAKSSGELPPGVGVTEKAAYLRLASSKDAGDIIAARWPELSGQVLQIEGGAE